MAAENRSTPRQVVFVQNSAHLAGAQKSLSRLLIAEKLRAFHPVLLTAQEGWLTRFCTENGVPWVCIDFPSPRSFLARWVGSVTRFAKRAAVALREHLLSGHGLIVHANDHPDSLIGLQVARELRASSVLTLRTPGMSQRDFIKHGCMRQQRIIVVGHELAQRVQSWIPSVETTLIYNGVTEEEIQPPAPAPVAQPGCVLVLGSLSTRKGWQDLVEALCLLELRQPEGPLPEFHFLGDLLGKNPLDVLKLHRLRRFRVSFLGVQENYRDWLRRYALAVHPSRSESFGMAALECVASGVPLVAGATGVIPQFIADDSFLYPPQDAAALAEKLRPLISLNDLSQITAAFDVVAAQERIREHFSTAGTVRLLTQVYASLNLHST